MKMHIKLRVLILPSASKVCPTTLIYVVWLIKRQSSFVNLKLFTHLTLYFTQADAGLTTVRQHGGVKKIESIPLSELNPYVLSSLPRLDTLQRRHTLVELYSLGVHDIVLYFHSYSNSFFYLIPKICSINMFQFMSFCVGVLNLAV